MELTCNQELIKKQMKKQNRKGTIQSWVHQRDVCDPD